MEAAALEAWTEATGQASAQQDNQWSWQWRYWDWSYTPWWERRSGHSWWGTTNDGPSQQRSALEAILELAFCQKYLEPQQRQLRQLNRLPQREAQCRPIQLRWLLLPPRASRLPHAIHGQAGETEVGGGAQQRRLLRPADLAWVSV